MKWLDSITNSINGHEFEQSLGDSGGQRSLAYCSPWGHKESDTTERLNNYNSNNKLYLFLLGMLILTTTLHNNIVKLVYDF